MLAAELRSARADEGVCPYTSKGVYRQLSGYGKRRSFRLRAPRSKQPF